MNINVSIERLVLDGLPVSSAQGSLLGAAVETELARLLATGGLKMGLQFGGAWQAMGLNASCDGSGNFKATFFLPTLTSGSVTAQCMDVWGLLSNTVIDPIV